MPLGPKPFIPCAGVAELVAQYVSGNQTCLNVYHFKKGAGTEWTDAELVALKTLFDDWESGDPHTARSNTTELVRVRIKDLTVEDGRILDQGSSIEGTMADPLAAQNVTIAIKANTGRSGRSNHGRSYWIGMPASRVTDGTVHDGYRLALIIAMNALVESAGTAGTPIGVLSLSHAGAWRAAGVFTPISNYSTTDDSSDSMRRRLPRH